jgi:hypothetical protein
MEKLGSHWTDVHEIWHLIIFPKSSTKIQVLLKSEKNYEYLKWRPVCTYDLISHNFWLQTKIVEKIKTHDLCSITFSRESCRLWDNVEKYCRTGQATYYNIIRRMRFACRITKARTQTHTIRCNTYCFSTATMVTRERLNVTLYVHWLSCLTKTYKCHTRHN